MCCECSLVEPTPCTLGQNDGKNRRPHAKRCYDFTLAHSCAKRGTVDQGDLLAVFVCGGDTCFYGVRLGIVVGNN